jgi:nucleotide-binding universal stress UspA family protein
MLRQCIMLHLSFVLFKMLLEAAMKILTVYDGTLQSKTALQYGLRKAKEKTGELIVLQVFPSGQFIDYGAGPRAEEIARAEAARHRRDAETIINEAGGDKLSVRVLSEEGDAVEEALRVSAAENVDLLLATPRYKAIAKKASCPVYIMPGLILVPVDNSEMLLQDRENILAESRATGSKILLLGIVPIHLYNAAEKKELEEVRAGTAAMVKRMSVSLAGQGVEVFEVLRSGYPDEEILKAADENAVSLIMLPAGGKTPSELTKAASILLDEPERVHMPIELMQAAEA